MEYLGFIFGIVFITLIILSVYFDFAEKTIDRWIKIEDKFYKLLIVILGIILLFTLFYRFY